MLILKKKEIILNEKKVEDKSEKKVTIYEEINENIIKNIPIMLIPCKIIDDSSTIIKHYKYCNKCERVNKNIYELVITLNNIDISDIEIIYDDDNILTHYLNDKQYNIHHNIEYIKIHISKKDNIILFEYTTVVENL